jgi:hypothetical protein
MSNHKWFILVLLAGYGLACYFAIWLTSVVLDRPLSLRWETRAQAISALFACAASLVHLGIRGRTNSPRRGFDVLPADVGATLPETDQESATKQLERTHVL